MELLKSWTDHGKAIGLVSDIVSNIPSIKLLELGGLAENSNFGHIRLRNFWITPRILWQRGLISFALKNSHETIVFLGSPYFLTTWLAAAISRVRRKRVLFWTHGVTHREPRISKFVRRGFFHLAHGLLLYGNWARDHLRDGYGLKEEKLYVIFNSLDYKKQVKIRKGLSAEAMESTRKELFPESFEDPVLVVVGRLTIGKKIQLLLEAAKKLNDAGMRVNILIIGDGESRDQLQQLAAELKISDRLKFFGSCYNEEQLALMIGSSELCIIPGALGLTAMHALAYGTPVVTNSNPEMQMPEFEAIIPGFNGEVFEPDNPGSLADSVSRWLNQDKDRQEIRRNCHFVMENFYNPEKQVELILNGVNGVVAPWTPVQRP